MIYFAVGQVLNVPLSIVIITDHAFIRYDDNGFILDWETTSNTAFTREPLSKNIYSYIINNINYLVHEALRIDPDNATATINLKRSKIKLFIKNPTNTGQEQESSMFNIAKEIIFY